MKKHLKKYFIPHEENEYLPHILRETALTVLVVIVLAVFVFSGLQTRILLNSPNFLAAILPGVLVDLANGDRMDNDLTPLTTNATLEAAAQLKANDMAAKSYFAHTSPEGITPWHWFLEAGYQFVAAGENLAVNFSDSADVEQAWMESPGHRANILNGEFTEIGIATARGTYKGQNTLFVVQLFGRPAVPQTPTVPIAVAETPVVEPEFVASEETPEVASETQTVEEQEPAEVAETPEATAEPVAVAGTDVPDTLEIIQEDELFLAVRDTAAQERENQELAGAEATGLAAPVHETTFVERLFAQPRRLATVVYMLLALFVLIALILNVGIEIRHQHPKYIMYGLFLLALIIVLGYIYHTFIFADLLIV